MQFIEWLEKRDPQLAEILTQEAGLLTRLGGNPLGKYLALAPLYLSLAANTPVHKDRVPATPAPMVQHQTISPMGHKEAQPEPQSDFISGIVSPAKQILKINRGGKNQYNRAEEAKRKRERRAELAGGEEGYPALVVNPKDYPSFAGGDEDEVQNRALLRQTTSRS